jgi:hypothetical protein
LLVCRTGPKITTVKTTKFRVKPDGEEIWTFEQKTQIEAGGKANPNPAPEPKPEPKPEPRSIE